MESRQVEAHLGRLRQTIAEFVFREPADINASDHFEDDLGLDSIDRIDLLTEVERQHDVAFSDEQIVAIVNVDQLVKTLRADMNGGEGQ